MLDDAFFTSSEYVTFTALVTLMGAEDDPLKVADMIGSLGAPRVALNAMADKFQHDHKAADHALAYGEHDKSQCGAWCAFPTGNERVSLRKREASRHTIGAFRAVAAH